MKYDINNPRPTPSQELIDLAEKIGIEDVTNKYPKVTEEEVLNPKPTINGDRLLHKDTPSAADIYSWWFFNFPEHFRPERFSTLR